MTHPYSIYHQKSLFEGLEEEDPVLQEAFQPRANAKRLVLRPKPISVTDTQSPDRAVITSPNVRETQSSKESVPESANKENQQQEDARRSADDRRSSTSW